MLIHNADITGSLLVNGIPYNTGSFTGSFFGDGSQLSGVTSYTDADTLAFINSIDVVSGSIETLSIVSDTFTSETSYTVTHNFNTKEVIVSVYENDTLIFPSSITTPTTNTVTVTFPEPVTGRVVVVKAGHIVSGSIDYSNVLNKPTLVSGSEQITYSGLTGIPSGIISGSAQISEFGIFATTGSNQFNGDQAITGSLTTTGQIIAQTLNVQQVTSSIVYSSGSNIFGNDVSNTQQFTGSVGVTGSLTVVGASTFNLGSGEMRLNRTGTSEFLKLNTYYLLTDGNDQLLGSVTGATNIYAGSGASPKLTIASTGAATFNTTATTAVSAISTGTASGLQLTNSGGTASSWIIQSDGGAVAGQAALRFYSLTASAYRMSIDGSGNVGIGTASVNTRLNVIKEDNDGGGIGRFEANNRTQYIEIGYQNINQYASVAGNAQLTFSTNSNERMRITSAGNVIIGNTTAYGGLTVSDFTSNDGNDSLAFFYRGTSGGHESLIKFYDFRGQVNAAIGNNLEDDGVGTQKSRLVFKTSYSGAPTERMRITSDGKISINNASTAYHQVAIKSNGVLTYNGLGVYSSSNDRWISINHTGTEGFVETENGGSGVMTPLSFKTAGQTRLTIPTNGYIRLTSNSGGIQFNGDTAEANALDDYEEGTFTPTVVGSTTAGTGTYVRQTGVYTKIGNLVTCNVWLDWSAHTGTGDILLAGFPFTSISTTNFRASGTFGWVQNLTLTANNIATMAMSPSETRASITQYPVGGGAPSSVAMDTAANLHYSITYQTA